MSFQQDKPLFEACLFVAEVDRAERTNPDVGEEETSATTLPEDKKARKRYMPCRKCPMVVPRSEEGSVCLTYGATKVFWLSARTCNRGDAESSSCCRRPWVEKRLNESKIDTVDRMAHKVLRKQVSIEKYKGARQGVHRTLSVIVIPARVRTET